MAHLGKTTYESTSLRNQLSFSIPGSSFLSSSAQHLSFMDQLVSTLGGNIIVMLALFNYEPENCSSASSFI